MTNPNNIAVASLVFDLPQTTNDGLQILPAGAFRSRDGRPDDCAAWVTTAGIAANLIVLANSSSTRLVIDYEHQTLNAAENGQPAPAAGWFQQMEWREGVGLFATDTEWTERAAGMIKAKEYKYLSPVFSYDKNTGEVLQILHVGLTNTPALDGMQAVALKTIQAALQHSNQPPEETMNPLLKALLAALGLPETTVEKDAMTAVTALKAKADQVTAKDQEIAALKKTADQVAVKDQEIAALKATATNTGNPDPAKFMPIEAVKPLQDQVAALSAKVHGREADEVVTVALKEGRILPGQEAWARELAGKDLSSLKTYLDNTTPIAALKHTQTGGKPPSGGDAALSTEQIAICKAMNLSQEDFKKTLAA
ncbi:phage protease [Undibacterium sp.]|uniref:phage protease n=1 Tax=Undibacterium sp. TaxID=1914977 RepID=UPI002731E6AD|nr:phage protease [Undibacterium sp.]MDP1980482.1 phage protease [Undibacterium sp.]